MGRSPRIFVPQDANILSPTSSVLKPELCLSSAAWKSPKTFSGPLKTVSEMAAPEAPINYAKIVDFFEDRRWDQLHERRLASLAFVCNANQQGFRIRDLAAIQKIIARTVELVQDAAEEQYLLPACKLVRLCSLPFQKCKATDDVVSGPSIVPLVTTIGRILDSDAPTGLKLEAAQTLIQIGSGYGQRHSEPDGQSETLKDLTFAPGSPQPLKSAKGSSSSGPLFPVKQPLSPTTKSTLRGGVAGGSSLGRNQGLLGESGAVEAAVRGFDASVRCNDVEVANVIGEALLEMSFSTPNAERMNEAGVVVSISHVLHSAPIDSEIINTAVELLWNVLERCPSAREYRTVPAPEPVQEATSNGRNSGEEGESDWDEDEEGEECEETGESDKPRQDELGLRDSEAGVGALTGDEGQTSANESITGGMAETVGGELRAEHRAVTVGKGADPAAREQSRLEDDASTTVRGELGVVESGESRKETTSCATGEESTGQTNSSGPGDARQPGEFGSLPVGVELEGCSNSGESDAAARDGCDGTGTPPEKGTPNGNGTASGIGTQNGNGTQKGTEMQGGNGNGTPDAEARGSDDFPTSDGGEAETAVINSGGNQAENGSENTPKEPFTTDALVASLAGLLTRCVSQGYKKSDRELVNELLIVAGFLAGDAGNLRSFATTGLLELLLVVSCTPELSATAGGTGMLQGLDAEALESKRLVWPLVTSAARDETCRVMVTESGFVLTLLMYLHHGQEGLPRWTASQLQELQKQACSCLSALVPLFPERIAECKGPELLIHFLVATSDDVTKQLIARALLACCREPTMAAAVRQLGAIGVALDLFKTRGLPSLLRQTALQIVCSLCEGNEEAQREFRKEGGIQALHAELQHHTALGAQSPGTLLATVVECVWRCVALSRKNLARFLALEGLGLLLQLLETSSPGMWPGLLSCLADVMDNPKAHPFFHEWRSERGASGARVVIGVWDRIQTPAENLENRKIFSSRGSASSEDAPERLTDVLKDTIYGLFSSLGFASFPYVSHADRAALVAIEQHIQFQEGRAWADIEHALAAAGVVPVEDDQAILDSKRAAVDTAARRVVVERARADELSSQEVAAKEAAFYAGLTRQRAEDAAARQKKGTGTMTMRERHLAKLQREKMLERSVQSTEFVFVDSGAPEVPGA